MYNLNFKFCCIFSLIILSSYSIYGQNTKFSIAGNIVGKHTLRTIKLLKYISPYERAHIADIPVIDNKFYYENDKIDEIDAYIIQHPNNPSTGYWFIWDGEVEMTISESSFHPTRIKSKLTSLRDSCSNFLAETYYNKGKELAKRISQEKAKGSDSKAIAKLEKERTIAIEVAQKGHQKFREEFINSHPNSFLSLFYLTESGFESGDAREVKLFELLSDDLKKHSRAKIYR